MPFNKISVVGLGYIGLPTAAMFASRGKQVIGVDVNQLTVDTINAGIIHIIEPKLDVMVKKAVDEGFLKAVITPEPADAFLIAVPTPFLPVTNESSILMPDLSYIQAAAKSVAKVLKKGDLVILESTSPVGATEQMAAWLAGERPDLTFPQFSGNDSDIRIAYCPERVLPGHAIRELVENDRVIGGMTDNCSNAAIDVYKIFVEGDCVVTNARTAEMVKLTENSFRDVNIAFANELSMICDTLDIDTWELINLANKHPRVNILSPGPGVGGHCIAVDPWFIVSKSPDQARLIRTAREQNDHKPAWVVNRILKMVLESGAGRIVFFGATFKPNIGDIRESPALAIIKSITQKVNVDFRLVEPNCVISNIDNVVQIPLEKVDLESDFCVMLVDHREFLIMKNRPKWFFDTRGVW